MKKYLSITIVLLLLTYTYVYPVVRISNSNNLKFELFDNCKITWDNNDFQGLVKIELWDAKRGEYYLLCNDYDSQKCFFKWYIYNEEWIGSMLRIRISEKNNPANYKLNNEFFEILLKNSNLPNIKINNNNPLLVYPNPTSSKINVSISENTDDYFYSISIINCIGENIYTEYLSSVHTLKFGYFIDVSSLCIGTYYIKVTGQLNNYYNKFTKI